MVIGKLYYWQTYFHFVQVAAQQQYVPVSMVEQSGRQMLLTVSFSVYFTFVNIV
jgi:hypothetical protein